MKDFLPPAQAKPGRVLAYVMVNASVSLKDTDLDTGKGATQSFISFFP